MEKEQEGCQVRVRVTKWGLAQEQFGWSGWCLPKTSWRRLCSRPPPSAALTWQPRPGPGLGELISEKLSRLGRMRRESRWVG